jgi:hypothetical protein
MVISRSFFVYLQKRGDEALRADRLSLLKQAADIAGEPAEKPKFLFFHILCPHEPFVFDENGDPVAYENMHNWTDPKHYAGQLIFLSKKIDELTSTILKQDRHSVVLLQSDHGSRFFSGSSYEERLACLNCVYLGGEDAEIEGLGLVDTLRLALTHSLGIKPDALGE